MDANELHILNLLEDFLFVMNNKMRSRSFCDEGWPRNPDNLLLAANVWGVFPYVSPCV